jgi:hypothetical protein
MFGCLLSALFQDQRTGFHRYQKRFSPLAWSVDWDLIYFQFFILSCEFAWVFAIRNIVCDFSLKHKLAFFYIYCFSSPEVEYS